MEKGKQTAKATWQTKTFLSTIFQFCLTLCSVAGYYQCPNPSASQQTQHALSVCEAHEACKYNELVIKTQRLYNHKIYRD